MQQQHYFSLMKLPKALQTEILLRLPVRCLLICQLVCKAFYSIVHNSNFENTHFTRTRFISSEQALVLQFNTFGSISHFLFLDDNSVLSSSPLTPKIPYLHELHLIGSANGLICFEVYLNDEWDGDEGYDDESDGNYVLWNPVTRQTRYLPDPDDCGFYGGQIKEFGFIPETTDYIFLRVGSIFGCDRIRIQLYKMSLDSWTIVDCGRLTDFDLYDGDLNQNRGLYRNKTSVFLKGCFHWAADGNICHFIVSFNLKDEELGLIKTPNHNRISDASGWDVAMVDESLAVMYWSNEHNNFQIWVMNDYRVKDSWILRFKISKCLWQKFCWKDSLFISTHETLYHYNLSTKKGKKVRRSQTGQLTCFSSFVLTLAPVRPKEPVGDTCRGRASEENPSREEGKRQFVEEPNTAARRPRITDSSDVHTLGCHIMVGENQGWNVGRSPPYQIVDNFNILFNADQFATLSEEQFMTETKHCFEQFAANFAHLCQEFGGGTQRHREDLEKSDNELKDKVQSLKARSKTSENSENSLNKCVDDLYMENKRLSDKVKILDQEKRDLLQELSRLKEEAKSRDAEITNLKDYLQKNDNLLKEIRYNLDVAHDELANARSGAAGSVQTGYKICFEKFVDAGAVPTCKSWEDYLVELHNKVNPDEDFLADDANKDINDHGNRGDKA